jgi:hypothetical protein
MSRGLLTLDHHFHLPLLGTNDYRLLAHPPHHVEGTLRLPAQGQFQRILLQASLDDLPQFLDNGEEAIRRAQSLQRLMWPLVVVVLHPQPHPLARRLETVELGPHQELFPDGLPEPFDLAQGHGMVRPALDVVNPILAPLRLEAGRPAPTGVRAALVGEHRLGHPVLGHRCAVHLQDVLRPLAAKQVQPHHVAGVIVQEADQAGVLAAQTEGEDAGLPPLVGRGTLEEAPLRGIAPGLGPAFFQELLLIERAANRLPAYRQKHHAPQELADLLDAQVGMTTLHIDDLRLDRGRHLRPPAAAPPGLAGRLPPAHGTPSPTWSRC